jgi:hypothetical protein
MNIKMLSLAAATSVVALASSTSAHTVSFGWTDNGNGSVTLWNEHWHGAQSIPYSDNGGLTISGDGTGSAYDQTLNPYTVQWAGTLNDTDRDDMISDGTLLGYVDDPGNGPGGTEDNWLFTDELSIGDGDWWFFTGPNCCIDLMTIPVLVSITGIGSVGAGTGPGQVPDAPAGSPSVVPLPAGMTLMLTGIGVMAGLRRRSKKKTG